MSEDLALQGAYTPGPTAELAALTALRDTLEDKLREERHNERRRCAAIVERWRAVAEASGDEMGAETLQDVLRQIRGGR